MDTGRTSSVGVVFPAYQESPLEIIESQTYSALSQGYGDINQHGIEDYGDKYSEQCCCKNKNCRHCHGQSQTNSTCCKGSKEVRPVKRTVEDPPFNCCTPSKEVRPVKRTVEDPPFNCCTPSKEVRPVRRTVEEPSTNCCTPSKETKIPEVKYEPQKEVKPVQKNLDDPSTCCNCCMPPKERRNYLVLKSVRTKAFKFPAYEEKQVPHIVKEENLYSLKNPQILDSEVERSYESPRENSTDMISSEATLEVSRSPAPELSEIIRFQEESDSLPPQSAGQVYSKRFLGQLGNELIRKIFPLYIPNEQGHSKTTVNNFDEIRKEYDGTTVDSINNQLRECTNKVEHQEMEGDNLQSDDDSIKRYCHVPQKYFVNKNYPNPEPFNQDRITYERQYKNNARHHDYEGINQITSDVYRTHPPSRPIEQSVSRNVAHRNDNEKTFNYVKNIFHTLTDWIKQYPSPKNPAHLPHESTEYQREDQIDDQYFKIEVCETPCGKETLIINKC